MCTYWANLRKGLANRVEWCSTFCDFRKRAHWCRSGVLFQFNSEKFTKGTLKNVFFTSKNNHQKEKSKLNVFFQSEILEWGSYNNLAQPAEWPSFLQKTLHPTGQSIQIADSAVHTISASFLFTPQKRIPQDRWQLYLISDNLAFTDIVFTV